MAIEGLKNTYIIPFINKDQRTDTNQRKKQNRNQKKENATNDEHEKKNKGKVDIRI